MNKDHTPGPWEVIVGYDGAVSVAASGSRRINLTTAGTPIIADIYDHADAENFSGLANARLIAAAPELLGALRGMLALDVEHSQRGPDDDDVCSEVRAARAAISKALGK